MIRVRKILVYVIAIFLTVWTLGPIYIMFDLSLMHSVEIFTIPFHFIPETPTPYNYARIFGVILPGRTYEPTLSEGALQSGFVNSAIATVVAPLIGITLSVLAGYSFARYEFKFKGKLLIFLILTRALPPITIIIPFYVILSQFNLLGTYGGLIIVYLSMITPLLTWVLIGHFATIPIDIERAARTDGCSRLQTIRKVVLPIAASGILASLLIAAMMVWNDFLFALIVSGGTRVQTLTPTIAGLFTNNTEYAIMSAAAVLGMIPTITVALLFQKYILRLRIVDPITAKAP